MQTEPSKRQGPGAADLEPRGRPPRGRVLSAATRLTPAPAGWNFFWGGHDLLFLPNGFHEAGTTDGGAPPNTKILGYTSRSVQRWDSQGEALSA